MKIYHFCSEKALRGIKTDGITKGMIPTVRRAEAHTKRKYNYILISGWQWLTICGDQKQSWATNILIKENRTKYRLTIEIPEKETESLYDREKLLQLYPEIGPLFDGLDGSENWRVFRGTIPKYWIKAVEQWQDGGWQPQAWR